MKRDIRGSQDGEESQIPIDRQRRMWNAWNAQYREDRVDESSLRQGVVVRSWLERLGRVDLDILEVGCGAGWFSPVLATFGKVTSTDLADELVSRARLRHPEITFIAGDFFSIDLPANAYDVVVTLEVLSHVSDQHEFVRRIASLLRPDGLLMLATQNRPILEQFMAIPPPLPGQVRHWVDRRELVSLLVEKFRVLEVFSVTPRGHRGLMRVVNSPKLNRVIRSLIGESFDQTKERIGLGWTLMALARVK